jgi:dienelactone hydrolase
MRPFLTIVALLSAGAPAASAEPAPAAAVSSATRDVYFPSDDIQLSSRLYAPPGSASYPVVVMVAGSGPESVMGIAETQAIARAFARAGIGVLAYDKRGTGKSGGAFTGSDFRALGRDAAAAIRFARQLPGVRRVGVWGISQAGWVIPYALQENPGAAFAILVSPGGINPHEQVTYFLHLQMRAAGLSEADADKADRMHRATVAYYATGRGYRAAQATIDRYREQPWFRTVVTHPYWDDMTGVGMLLTPAQLAAAVAKHPDNFEMVRSASSFTDYAPLYARIRVPTLLVYGSADQLVPGARSRAVIEPALRRAQTPFDVRIFDGADHNIQSPDQQVRPDYLEAITVWAKARFDKPD